MPVALVVSSFQSNPIQKRDADSEIFPGVDTDMGNLLGRPPKTIGRLRLLDLLRICLANH